MLNAAYQAVKRFNELARREVPRVPTMPDADVKMELAARIYEEVTELVEAETLRDMVDALIDILYVTLDACVQIGLNPSPFFAIVSAANLRKAWPDGWMRVNDRGKVIKPESWTPPEPEIERELSRQGEEAAA